MRLAGKSRTWSGRVSQHDGDDHFRRFNGHTQVNATHLRLMKYPSRQALIALGKWARAQSGLTQAMLDDQLKKLSE